MMSKRAQLMENYEDAYFALLMDAVAQEEGERYFFENQELLENPNAELPLDITKRTLSSISHVWRKKRRQTVFRSTKRLLNCAAIMIALVSVLFTTAFAVSSELRIATVNLILTVTDEYTQFSMFDNTQSREDVPSAEHNAEYFDSLEIGWLPAGYEYVDGEYNSWVGFQNNTGHSIIINIHIGHGIANVDTENADEIEEVKINGNSGLCILKDERVQIYIANMEKSMYFEILANSIPVETVKEMAEQISFI